MSIVEDSKKLYFKQNFATTDESTQILQENSEDRGKKTSMAKRNDQMLGDSIQIIEKNLPITNNHTSKSERKTSPIKKSQLCFQNHIVKPFLVQKKLPSHGYG